MQADKQLGVARHHQAPMSSRAERCPDGPPESGYRQVFGKGKLKILPDQTQYDALLNMTYEARLRYDKAQSASSSTT